MLPATGLISPDKSTQNAISTHFIILFFVALLSIFLLSFLYVELIYRLTIVFGCFDAIQIIRSRSQNIRIILVTAHEHDEYLEQALKAAHCIQRQLHPGAFPRAKHNLWLYRQHKVRRRLGDDDVSQAAQEALLRELLADRKSVV